MGLQPPDPSPQPPWKHFDFITDRVFTIPGFGTVVTGTLLDGCLRVGDEVEVLPRRLRGRVRGLQTHQQKEQTAVPGSRTAVNISGISVDEVKHGDVIAHSGDYRPTQRVDLHFSLLPDVSQPLKHNTDVKLFIGTSEILARLRLLGVEQLKPGESGWLQLELNQPIVAARSDRYILRRPSPGETLGGGEIVDPHPSGRHKRFAPSTLASLETISKGTPDEVLLQASQSLGAASAKDLISHSNLEIDSAVASLHHLLAAGQLIDLDKDSETENYQPEDLVITKSTLDRIVETILTELSSYHRSYPLRSGMPKEELKSRLKGHIHGSARLFNT